MIRRQWAGKVWEEGTLMKVFFWLMFNFSNHLFQPYLLLYNINHRANLLGSLPSHRNRAWTCGRCAPLLRTLAFIIATTLSLFLIIFSKKIRISKSPRHHKSLLHHCANRPNLLQHDAVQRNAGQREPVRRL